MVTVRLVIKKGKGLVLGLKMGESKSEVRVRVRVGWGLGLKLGGGLSSVRVTVGVRVRFTLRNLTYMRVLQLFLPAMDLRNPFVVRVSFRDRVRIRLP
jgi:hypothetical protein